MFCTCGCQELRVKGCLSNSLVVGPELLRAFVLKQTFSIKASCVKPRREAEFQILLSFLKDTTWLVVSFLLRLEKMVSVQTGLL